MSWRVDLPTRGAAAYRETVSQRRLPAEIYWRRRMLLLAAVIAVVWVVLQLTGGDGDAQPTTEPTKAPAKAAPTTVATPVVPTTPEPKVNGLVDVALERAAEPCDPVQVRVTPTVRPGQLNQGPVDIGLVVSSTEEQACTLTPEAADAIAVISANGTAIWDSTVCKTSLLTAPVAISPQWATLASVQWTGRGSGAAVRGQRGLRDARQVHAADRHAGRRAGQDDVHARCAARTAQAAQAGQARQVGQDPDAGRDTCPGSEPVAPPATPDDAAEPPVVPTE